MFGSMLAIALLTPGHTPADAACPVVEKVCVAEPVVKVKERWVYSCKCVEFCLPQHSALAHSDCPECGNIRTKKVLMKRLCVEEKPGYKCVPGIAPCDSCPKPGH
jgi:hypothetical protein